LTEIPDGSTMLAVARRPPRDRFTELDQQLRTQIGTVKEQIGTVNERVDRVETRIDALSTEMRQQFEQMGRQFEQTRRHFDVVAEGLMSKIELVAEGVVAGSERLERFRGEVRGELDRVDARVLRLEARVSALENPRP
jgi:chromosome segregation ATPase